MAQPRYVSKTLTAASANNISLSQTPAGAGNMLINGSAATSGVATLDTQRQVLFTFAADESAHTFVIYGTDGEGTSISETVTGTASTAVTLWAYKTVTRISISAAAAGAITVGTNGVGWTAWSPVNVGIGAINLGIAVLVTGTVNYSFQYTLEDVTGTFPNPTGAIPTAFDLTQMSAQTASQSSSIWSPISAWRLTINSGTGTAQAVVVQSGYADS